MSYTRAISSIGAPELDILGLVKLASAYKIDAIEVRTRGDNLSHEAVYFADKFGTTTELMRQRAMWPVSVLALNTSYKLSDPDNSGREVLLEFVPWAQAIGAKWLRVFDGGRDSSAPELARCAETLSWWRDVLLRYGWSVDLMVETHDSLFTAEKVKRLIALVTDVKILWDTHHTWKIGGVSPTKTWSGISRQVMHIHVKDSISIPSEKMNYTYALPGTGAYPMAELRSSLVGPEKPIYQRAQLRGA